MRYRIVSLETVKGSSLLYADVEFLSDAGTVIHRNDFVMQIAPTTRVYTGPELSEGQRPNPRDYQTVEADVRAAIIANIENYIIRHQGDFSAFPPDNRTPQIERDTSDPLNLRTRSGVVELIGEDRQR